MRLKITTKHSRRVTICGGGNASIATKFTLCILQRAMGPCTDAFNVAFRLFRHRLARPSSRTREMGQSVGQKLLYR